MDNKKVCITYPCLPNITLFIFFFAEFKKIFFKFHHKLWYHFEDLIKLILDVQGLLLHFQLVAKS